MQSILENIGLDKDQIKSILTGEIKKLADQEKALIENVTKLAKQTDDLFEKRKLAAEAAEAASLEQAAKEKKLIDDLEVVRSAQRDLEKEKVEIIKKRELLNSEREQYQKERVIAREADQDLAKRQKDLNFKIEELKKRELELMNREDDVKLRTKSLNEIQFSLTEQQNKLTADLGAFSHQKAVQEKSLENAAEEVRAAHRSEEAALLKLQEGLKDLEDQKKAFEKECDEEREVLRKRELDIVRKEKDIENRLREAQTKLEDAEIKASRQEEKPKKTRAAK